MNAPPEVVEILRQWVRKAEHDLQAPRAHDLKVLASLIPAEQFFPLTIEELVELNP